MRKKRNYMKIFSIKNIVSICVLSLTLFACTPKDELVSLKDIAPKNSTLVLWCGDADDWATLRDKAEYKALITALKQNAKVQAQLKEFLNNANKETNGISSLFLSKDDPVASFENLYWNAFDEFLFYTENSFSEKTKQPKFAFVLRGKDKTFFQNVKTALNKTEQAKPHTIGTNECFMFADKNIKIYVSVKSNYIVISDFENMVLSVFNSIKTKPAESILNNEKFSKLSDNKFGQFFAYISSDIISNSVKDAKSVKDEIDAVYMDIFASPKKECETFNLKIAFNEKSKIIKSLKDAKLPVAHTPIALPKSEIYLHIAMPIITEEILKSYNADPMIVGMTMGILPILKNIKSVETSVINYNTANQTMLYNLYVDNVDALLQSQILSMYMMQFGFEKKVVSGVECFITPALKNVYIVKVSDKQLSIVVGKDTDVAIKCATAKIKPEQSAYFSKMNVSENLFFKSYTNWEFAKDEFENIKEIRKVIYAINKENLNESIKYEVVITTLELMLKMYKECQIVDYIQINNNILKYNSQAKTETTLEPLIDFVKNYK